MEAGARETTVAGVLYALPAGRPSAIAPPAAGEGASRRFVSASDLETIVLVEKRSWVAEVGGVLVGVGAVHGRVLTLVRLGAAREAEGEGQGAALLCHTESGEAFLIEGGTVERVGRFPASGDATIEWGGSHIERLDVTALYRAVEKQLWERRWITREQHETKTPH